MCLDHVPRCCLFEGSQDCARWHCHNIAYGSSSLIVQCAQDGLFKSLFKLNWEITDGEGLPRRRNLESRSKRFYHTISTDGVSASVHFEQLPNLRKVIFSMLGSRKKKTVQHS